MTYLCIVLYCMYFMYNYIVLCALYLCMYFMYCIVFFALCCMYFMCIVLLYCIVLYVGIVCTLWFVHNLGEQSVPMFDKINNDY